MVGEGRVKDGVMEGKRGEKKSGEGRSGEIRELFEKRGKTRIQLNKEEIA